MEMLPCGNLCSSGKSTVKSRPSESIMREVLADLLVLQRLTL